MSSPPARPRLATHLMFGVLAAVAVAGFAWLGRWQWHRAAEKRAIAAAFQAGMSAPVQPLEGRSTESLPRYAHVAARGAYDGERQFLLDNLSRDGRAGYEVLTPLRLDDGRWLLVNRGWLPLSGGGRQQLPAIRLGQAALDTRTVAGRLDDLPVTGLSAGRAPPTTDAQWPKLTSFPHAAELGVALGARVETRQLLLDANEPDGYRRDWQPSSAGFGPERHLSYAVQWWSLAALVVVVYVYMTVRSVRG